MVKILKDNAMHLLQINIATEEQDTKEATDLVIDVIGGTVAVRTRRHATDKGYRDFTIRCRSTWGQKTEIDKLREGYAKWYLYAWEQRDGGYEYILLDMDRVRDSGLLDGRKQVIINRDGRTGFVSISLFDLNNSNCIINKKLTPRTNHLLEGGRF